MLNVFAFGVAFGYMLPFIQEVAYRWVYYLETGRWTVAC